MPTLADDVSQLLLSLQEYGTRTPAPDQNVLCWLGAGGIDGFQQILSKLAMSAPLACFSVEWFERLQHDLVCEFERAMEQRDRFLANGIGTATPGQGWDTCFTYVVRKHLTVLGISIPNERADVPAQPDRLPDNCNDPVLLWREIESLRAAIKGPPGYPTWAAAALHERTMRVAGDVRLKEALRVLAPQLAAAVVETTVLPPITPEPAPVVISDPVVLCNPVDRLEQNPDGSYNVLFSLIPSGFAPLDPEMFKTLQTQASEGTLFGEYGHPTRTASCSDEAWMQRVQEIPLTSACFRITELQEQMQPSGTQLICGTVKSLENAAVSLEGVLTENAGNDISFGYRGFTSIAKDSNGASMIDRIVTWDLIPSPQRNPDI
jgi:hypothetical protein